MFLPQPILRLTCALLNTVCRLRQRRKTKSAAPVIKDIDETLRTLAFSVPPLSICRFGDGELNMIRGKHAPFQKSSLELRRRLIEVLRSSHADIMVGIPRIAFKIDDDITPENSLFWLKKGKRFRKVLLSFINPRQTYYAAEVSLAYSYHDNDDFESYFASFRHIWEDKDVVLITGRTVFDKITYNIFDNARSVEYLYGPSRNAFEEYDDILSRALQIDKSKLILTILGPTATILAYDLALKGYRALDLGHIAKSYDMYKKGIRPGGKGCTFYRPD